MSHFIPKLRVYREPSGDFLVLSFSEYEEGAATNRSHRLSGLAAMPLLMVAFFAAAALGGCGPSATVEQNGSGGDFEAFPAPCADPQMTGVCGEAKCGNGVRDTCESCISSNGGPVTCTDVTEGCDGEDLGGESCQSLGYPGGGKIRCAPGWCTLEVRDCDSCVGAPNQVACARPRVTAVHVGSLALASDGDVVAAAWTTHEDILGFARFSPDLKLLDHRSCSPPAERGSVALAPVPGGWVLAVGGVSIDSAELSLYRLDSAGNELAPPRKIMNAVRPALAARPGAPPLLVYGTTFAATGADVIAELLDEQGQAVWTTTIYGPANPDAISAAYADPGFVVAVATFGMPTSLLVPVDATGMLGMPQQIADAYKVDLAPAGAGRIAANWKSTGGYMNGWVDGSGMLAGAPTKATELDPIKLDKVKAIVVAGGRAVTAFAETSPAPGATAEDVQIGLAHVADTGAVAVPEYILARERGEVSAVAAAEVAGEAVLVWTMYTPNPAASRFVLARVRP